MTFCQAGTVYVKDRGFQSRPKLAYVFGVVFIRDPARAACQQEVIGGSVSLFAWETLPTSMALPPYGGRPRPQGQRLVRAMPAAMNRGDTLLPLATDRKPRASLGASKDIHLSVDRCSANYTGPATGLTAWCWEGHSHQAHSCSSEQRQ